MVSLESTPPRSWCWLDSEFTNPHSRATQHLLAPLWSSSLSSSSRSSCPQARIDFGRGFETSNFLLLPDRSGRTHSAMLLEWDEPLETHRGISPHSKRMVPLRLRDIPRYVSKEDYIREAPDRFHA